MGWYIQTRESRLYYKNKVGLKTQREVLLLVPAQLMLGRARTWEAWWKSLWQCRCQENVTLGYLLEMALEENEEQSWHDIYCQATARKCQEQHQPRFITFVDLNKAFDTVSRPGLWKIMAKIRLSCKLHIYFSAIPWGHESSSCWWWRNVKLLLCDEWCQAALCSSANSIQCDVFSHAQLRFQYKWLRYSHQLQDEWSTFQYPEIES